MGAGHTTPLDPLGCHLMHPEPMPLPPFSRLQSCPLPPHAHARASHPTLMPTCPHHYAHGMMMQGEAAAVMGALAALTDCLGRDGGCAVVPGLPPEQYTATLVCAATGGLVAGFVGRIEPQGML